MSGVDPHSVVGDAGGGFAGSRLNYDVAELDERDVGNDPLDLFRRWLDDAHHSDVVEPTAMAVSTVDGDGRVTSRNVLLRQIGERGPIFFTNYRSEKGQALEENPRCAAVMWWAQLQRQVRIEGVAVKVPAAASDAYFASRPRGSQIGAWASPQSDVIADRAVLEALVADAETRFAEAETIARPPHWGGYEIVADRFEFWQGRPSRLHDRLRFDLMESESTWSVVRLAP